MEILFEIVVEILDAWQRRLGENSKLRVAINCVIFAVVILGVILISTFAGNVTKG